VVEAMPSLRACDKLTSLAVGVSRFGVEGSR
jgi:hypothetical protein